MKRTLNLIALLLCLIALLSLLPACKKKEKAPEPTKDTVDTGAEETGGAQTTDETPAPKRPTPNGDHEPSSEGLIYTEKGDGTFEVTGFDGEVMHNKVVIPDTYRGKAVTSIKERVFYDCEGLFAVTIGANVTAIGDAAFEKCDGLAEIVIPAGVVTIGAGAFRSCTDLRSVSIAQSVTTVGAEAFRCCGGLMRLTYGGTLEQWGAVTKGADWNAETDLYTFICSDGTYTKEDS